MVNTTNDAGIVQFGSHLSEIWRLQRNVLHLTLSSPCSGVMVFATSTKINLPSIICAQQIQKISSRSVI
ncbi:hypothetical protein HanIR_Chr05g0213141 [Helianthus annuus]|nr:hypothetical protein HanIR_Chr05g0213141 [Helianthus annuus]